MGIFITPLWSEYIVSADQGGIFMDHFNVYSDIQARTGGEIYIGVVGPVRTGKSTFIKRFMELLVLPGLEDVHARERARDELPQSSAGKTIMTTEPKFIPKEAAKLSLGDGVEVRVRLIDCVGFMVEGAAGHIENEKERMVRTPWYEEEIPFTAAAELGTRKVITDHSTIGLVVTADGSFGELKRENYVPAEEKTVQELKKLGKPFLVLLNSQKPYSEETRALPEETGEAIRRIRIVSMKMDDGSVQAVVELDDGHYYQILSEYVGMPIEGEYQLMQTLKRLASMQSEYEKASVALTQARKKGYGVVTPERGEIVLDEPQVVRHGNKYGVKMKAQAPSINLIKAQIETEIAPIVGNEQQAEDLIRYIRENAGKGEEGIWETNIFGKSIAQIVDDGIQAKISQLTEDCQVKLQDTLQKIINDSNGGMICIII